MTTIALNILDIVQNSIRADASLINLSINESASSDILEIRIEDDGSGIPAEMLDTVTDPFTTSRTTRKTGFGLALLKHHAELTGGKIDIKSSKGSGTVVTAEFRLSHIDIQPLGDVAGVMIILIAGNPGIDFLYTHRTDAGEYSFSTKEAKEFLGVASLNEGTLPADIKEMISENLARIGVSDDFNNYFVNRRKINRTIG